MNALKMSIFSIIIIFTVFLESFLSIIPLPTSVILYYLFKDFGFKSIRNGFLLGKFFSYLAMVLTYGFYFLFLLGTVVDLFGEIFALSFLSFEFSEETSIFVYNLIYLSIVHLLLFHPFVFLLEFFICDISIVYNVIIVFMVFDVFFLSIVCKKMFCRYLSILEKVNGSIKGFENNGKYR